MFRTVPLSIIRRFSLYTQQRCMSYSFADGLRETVSKPLWQTPLLCVQWKTPDDEQRSYPKHVEFYSKNKFDKFVHLVGFIIRIYHDARSPERQTLCVPVYLKAVLLNIKELIHIVTTDSWSVELKCHR